MRKIVFITGGQRSGKSSYAQACAQKLSDHPVYLATAHPWDEDFQSRIQRHRDDRGTTWETIEEEVHLGRIQLNHRVVVLDCITLWLTNIYHQCGYNTDTAFKMAGDEWRRFREQDFTLLVVSNELGMGIHADHESARKFADLQGWVNQMIAAEADDVFLMISGIPLKIK